MQQKFVLEPRSKDKGDPYAKASRMAMYVYANWISKFDPELAKELTKWARREEFRDRREEG